MFSVGQMTMPVHQLLTLRHLSEFALTKKAREARDRREAHISLDSSRSTLISVGRFSKTFLFRKELFLQMIFSIQNSLHDEMELFAMEKLSI